MQCNITDQQEPPTVDGLASSEVGRFRRCGSIQDMSLTVCTAVSYPHRIATSLSKSPVATTLMGTDVTRRRGQYESVLVGSVPLPRLLDSRRVRIAPSLLDFSWTGHIQ